MACFVAGCLLAASAVCWATAAVRGNLIVPGSAWLAVIAVTPYAAVMLATFDRSSHEFWLPLFRTTPTHLLLTRIMLAVAVIFVLASLITARVAMANHDRVLLDSTFPFLMGSLAFLNGCYISVHWAFRPENVFRHPVFHATKFWGATKRALLVTAGLAGVVIAILGRSPWTPQVSMWRRFLAFGLGLFLAYCGAMYYLPKYRRMRREHSQDDNE